MPVVLPPWYGVRYPRVDDLESYAWTLRGTVERGPLQGLAACTFFDDGITVIELDSAFGILEEHWQLAHEIGHLVLHCGYISPWTKDRQEWQAKLFAACALIPEERVRAYQNACEDAFVGALSANYEDIPLEDCPLRRLALFLDSSTAMAATSSRWCRNAHDYPHFQ